MEYTPGKIKEILKDLDISPYKVNKVDSNQAAKILTWRLKEEQGIHKDYTTTALRRRVSTGKLPVAETISTRLNLYDVRDIFELSLMPQKAGTTKKSTDSEKNTIPTIC